MTAVTLAPVKNGDTFEITYSLPISFGSIVASIFCQIQASGLPKESLTVDNLDPTSEKIRWLISAPASQTSTWKIGLFSCDIKHVTVDGKIIHTDTFSIPVIKAVTE